MGGLCNRLRTIDSFIDICKKNNFELEILWTSDVTLNSPFSSLFKDIIVDDLKIKVIDCPQGFPEVNLIKMGANSNGEFAINLNKTRNPIKNKIKQLVYSRKLKATHNLVLKDLKELTFDSIITNDELEKLYNSGENLKSTIRELDKNFFPKVELKVANFLNKKYTVYVSCCYRLSALSSNYQYLKPINDIHNKIELVSKDFGEDTIGLHVRRTDHVASKVMSSNDKFKKVVDKEIAINSNVKFYLSTDDPNFKAEFSEKYPNRIITNPVSSYDRNNASAIEDAVVDLFCLSKTTRIYGSHQSSFSQTAADLNKMEEIIV